jgi:CBS domain-containing protein
MPTDRFLNNCPNPRPLLLAAARWLHRPPDRSSSNPSRFKEVNMKISDVMTRDVERATPETTLQQVAGRMRDLDMGSLPVVDRGGRVVGVITDRDIVIRSTAEGSNPRNATAQQAMTPDVVFCYEDQRVEDAAQLMKDREVRRLLVLDRNDGLAGIVSLGDLAVQTGDDAMTGDALETVSAAPANR